jgi:hypothetical protein
MRADPKGVDRFSAQEVVKKSAAAMAPQCAFKNVCHDVGRSGTGGRPAAFNIRRIVVRPTRWPTFSSAPWIRV